MKRVENSQVGLGEKLAYGLGDVGGNLIFATVGAFMTFFYTDIAGIGAAVIGTMMMLSRLLDGSSDIIMGIVIDKTHTRWGKARPWLLYIAVPYGLSAVLLFTVPDYGMTGKIIYAFLTYNFMSTICFTVFNMPYGTLAALMTQDQNERSILVLIRMLGGTGTALVASLITVPLVASLGGGACGWQRTAAIFGAVATIILLITFFFTHERVQPINKKKIPTKVAFRALAENKYWKMILVVGLLTFILFGLPGVNIYYAQYVLGSADYFASLMTAVYLPNLIVFVVLLAVPSILKRFGKRNVVLAGFFVYLIGSAILLNNPLDLRIVLLGSYIKGFGFGPLVATLYAFVADTIEYGEWKTGVRNEGLLYSAASFGQKVGTGLALAIIGWGLQLGGYVANAAVQSASSIVAMKTLFIYIPVVVYALIAIILHFYKLDKEYDQIVRELDARRQAQE